jgi:hypothetical protein
MTALFWILGGIKFAALAYIVAVFINLREIFKEKNND